MRIALKAFIVAFLLFPILVLILRTGGIAAVDPTEVWPVLKFTVLQAFLSASLTLGIGILGALGLISYFGSKGWSYFEGVLLAPNILPVLFVIMSVMNWAQVIKISPMGLWGVVTCHTLMNVGLVSLSLAYLLRSKISRSADLSLVEGASFLSFFYEGVLRYLKRDIALIFLFVFSLCFSSFAIPLVLGGYNGVTLEVLIYQKLKVAGSWSQATTLCLLQLVVVFVLSLFLPRRPSKNVSENGNLRLLQKPSLIGIPILVTLLLTIGLFVSGSKGAWVLWKEPSLWSEYVAAGAITLIVALGTGGLVLLVLSVLLFSQPGRLLKDLLVGLAAPSTVIIGFSLLVLGSNSEAMGLVKLSVGLTIIAVPITYRLYIDESFQGLQKQLETARVLGASGPLIFKEIVWPQMQRPLVQSCALASLWASGDFALSSIILSGDLTLALHAKTLMSTYRLELASCLVLVILILGVLGALSWRLWIGVDSKRSSGRI